MADGGWRMSDLRLLLLARSLLFYFYLKKR